MFDRFHRLDSNHSHSNSYSNSYEYTQLSNVDTTATTFAMSSQRVAVIGAGICGLVSLKESVAAGLDAVCFEARDGLGGAWAYQAQADEDPQSSSSIYLGTMLNSCRDTSAFSDFPFDPARYPDCFGHKLLVQYLQEYAAHFGLDKHVRLQTRVLKCEPARGRVVGGRFQGTRRC